ncbi:hypothetical protein QE152_g40725 [Popillia japonica]|uniref:Uncharacterized protein n=1 Tax=Popillia japonica TaxID=7064 RepID=A0AAW1HFP3_POPJA
MVINSEGINPIEDSFNKIRELKEVMDVHPTKKIILYASEGLNQEYIRKMCECKAPQGRTNEDRMGRVQSAKKSDSNKMLPMPGFRPYEGGLQWS